MLTAENRMLEQKTGEALLMAYAAYGAEGRIDKLADVPQEAAEAVRDSLATYPTATGMILASNHNLSSRPGDQCGHTIIYVFGPDNTVKELPDRGAKSPIVPHEARGSVRAHFYIVDAWASRESLLEAVAGRLGKPA
jgi:hypothetical protein